LRGIGVTQTARRQFDAARETLIQAVAVARELSERDRPLLSGVLSDLANVEYRVHRLETAEKIISEVLAIDEKILGKSHPDYLISANNLARYKFEGGELGAAKSVLTEVLKHEAALSAYFGPEFSYFINTMGEIEASMGDWSGAIGKFRQALLIAEGPKHRLFPVAMINLGASTCIVEENDHGLEKIREGRKLLADHYAESDWRFAVADEFESRCLVASSRAADAIVLAKTGYDRLRSELGDDHYFTRRAKSWLGSLQMRQRD
jgi:tetratricopeptide (TPR) repeat protein